MKKIISILIILSISAVLVTAPAAEGTNATVSTAVTAGVLNSVKCFPGSFQDKIVIPLDNYKGYKLSRLSKPDRIILDIPNTTGPSPSKTVNVKGCLVKTVRYATFDKKTARVVLDVIGQPQYFVEEGKGQLILYVVKPLSKNLFYYTDTTQAHIVLKGAKLAGSGSAAAKPYTEKLDSSGRIYTLTFANNLADMESRNITVNDAYIGHISVSKNTVTNKTTVSLFAMDKFSYNVASKAQAGGAVISIIKNSGTGRGGDDSRDIPAFNVSHSVEGNADRISIAYLYYQGYTITQQKDPHRLVLDIPGSNLVSVQKQINTESPRLKAIRYFQLDGDTLRLEADLNGQCQYRTEEKEGELVIYLEDLTYRNIEYTNDENGVLFKLNGIKLKDILDNNTKHYTESTDSTGRKLTITFSSSIGDLGNGIMQINDSYFYNVEIRTDSFSNQTTIVFNSKGRYSYNISVFANDTIIGVKNQYPIKNIKYNNSGDRVHLILAGKIKLTGDDLCLKKLYTGTYDGNRYTMTFADKQASFGAGIIDISDSMLDSIEIVYDAASGQTSLIFNAKSNFLYLGVYRDKTKDNAIDILKPYTKEDRLVVIDAGHGGVDPGAAEPGVTEKYLNLDISTRLNSLLKSRGIKTYMTRQEDAYLGLYERAYIANEMNASLFMCVHNNSNDSRSLNGTSMLYYGNTVRDGFNNKELAQILQKSLQGALKTKDRGLSVRPDLVVLKATKMPAALAEVAFMSNESDRKKLLTEDFRQKAAEGLCEGVIEALNRMGN